MEPINVNTLTLRDLGVLAQRLSDCAIREENFIAKLSEVRDEITQLRSAIAHVAGIKSTLPQAKAATASQPAEVADGDHVPLTHQVAAFAATMLPNQLYSISDITKDLDMRGGRNGIYNAMTKAVADGMMVRAEVGKYRKGPNA